MATLTPAGERAYQGALFREQRGLQGLGLATPKADFSHLLDRASGAGWETRRKAEIMKRRDYESKGIPGCTSGKKVEVMLHRGSNRALPDLQQMGRAVFFAAWVAFFAAPVPAAGFSEQQQLVERALSTIERFAADESMESFHEFKKEAKAVFIVPELSRAALVIGGARGSGVFLARDERTGTWSQPVFYTMGSASFGLQVGRDAREVILIIRSTRGLESFYTTGLRLGTDASVATGPTGAGTGGEGLTHDIISFSRGEGAYAGISLEGARITVSDESNEAYYGEPARPVEILLKDTIVNPKSLDLRDALTKAMQ